MPINPNDTTPSPRVDVRTFGWQVAVETSFLTWAKVYLPLSDVVPPPIYEREIMVYLVEWIPPQTTIDPHQTPLQRIRYLGITFIPFSAIIRIKPLEQERADMWEARRGLGNNVIFAIALFERNSTNLLVLDLYYLPKPPLPWFAYSEAGLSDPTYAENLQRVCQAKLADALLMHQVRSRFGNLAALTSALTTTAPRLPISPLDATDWIYEQLDEFNPSSVLEHRSIMNACWRVAVEHHTEDLTAQEQVLDEA